MLGLAGWVVLCFSVSAVGIYFTPGAWYSGLNKPTWNPPGWIFGPVWTALYLMMGVSAWLVWQRGGFATQRRPLVIFLVQLALNACWSPLFFGLHSPGLAFGEIIVLWVAIASTIVAFRGVKRWRNESPSMVWRIPSIQPKQSAWSTASDQLNDGRPVCFL